MSELLSAERLAECEHAWNMQAQTALERFMWTCVKCGLRRVEPFTEKDKEARKDSANLDKYGPGSDFEWA